MQVRRIKIKEFCDPQRIVLKCANDKFSSTIGIKRDFILRLIMRVFNIPHTSRGIYSAVDILQELSDELKTKFPKHKDELLFEIIAQRLKKYEL